MLSVAILAQPVAAPLSNAGPRHARAVEWARSGDTVRLSVITPWKGARKPLEYVLLPGAPGAKRAEGEVRLPARRIVCLAAVHVGFLAALGEAGRVIAVDAGRHVYDAGVRARVADRSVMEVGSGTGLDIERLLVVKPDLVLANAVGASENASLDRLRRAGIPVLVTAEWMESDPLARAEWVRLIGMLVGKSARADSLFATVEASYRARAAEARGQKSRPTVLLGAPFRDQWFVAGGRSFMARLLRDAGAEYPWAADTTVGGVPLGFEAVLARARDADVWLHPSDWHALREGLKRDARFSSFTAFKRGDVYDHDARRRPDGADDYWESGAVRPDRVLADLVSILHGQGDSLFYYRRLPK
ncbi:MAG TPA: helical backbone metal receptor [Fibrobacteria bacterium]|nr:helical backbone metal receptor [Fibrobacteria bacterium]